MQPHTIASYDADLKALDELVGDMAHRAEASLADAAKALFAGDVQLAQQVIAADAAIDLLQHNIEEKAISTIATRQPVAVDLRQIVSTIRIASDLERIGDLAKNVAKRVIAMGEQPASVKVASSLAPLAARVRDQLQNVSARLSPARRRRRARGVAVGRRHRHAAHLALPRAADLHDGGPAQHRLLRAPPLLRQEPRAHRRPRDQHRRDHALHDHGRHALHRAPEG